MLVKGGQLEAEEGVQRNEEAVLSALRLFGDMLGNLAQLSDIIYAQDSRFPLDIYRTFRRLYENSEAISNILENYESSNHEFLQLKDELVAEQIAKMEHIINREDPDDSERRFPQRRVQQRSEGESAAVFALQR